MSFPLPLDPAAYAQTILSAASQNDWETHAISPVGSWQRPWFRHYASNSTDAPCLYISTGIHGDEPAGPYAALELVRHPEIFRHFNVILFPLLNPSGFAAGTRENAAGVDLNRDYNHPRTDEILGHIVALRSLGQIDLSICLHEDWETKGVYLYELNRTSHAAIGRKILAAMSSHIPIEQATVIEESTAENGLIVREIGELLSSRPHWAEAFYLIQHHTALGYTLETPSKAASLEARVAAQLAAVEVAADFLRQQRPLAPSAPKAAPSQ
jgi:murein peptide amidase A